jgi:phosphate transport system substrate-binding protein
VTAPAPDGACRRERRDATVTSAPGRGDGRRQRYSKIPLTPLDVPRHFRPLGTLPIAAALAALAACGSDSARAPTSRADSSAVTAGAQPGAARRTTPSIELTGAGATFPYPVYSRWISDYLAATGVRINYQSIGSGGGIRQLAAGTVDFGATDVPMTPRELAGVRGGHIVHVPTVLGSVAITYNLPTVARPLRVSSDVLADIYLGRLRRWNDPRLAALNPGTSLPADDILVVHRADGSGTTYIFTDYLTAVSPAWASGPGRGRDVRWPVGIGGRGNEGVAGEVKATPGTITYVETTYARQNRLPVAEVRNRAGAFVAPSVEAVSAAAAAATAQLPPEADYRVSIVNAPGAASYPISSITWLLLDPSERDTRKTHAVVDFARWALRDGAVAARALGYTPLPPEVARRVDARLSALRDSLLAPRRGGADGAGR